MMEMCVMMFGMTLVFGAYAKVIYPKMVKAKTKQHLDKMRVYNKYHERNK